MHFSGIYWKYPVIKSNTDDSLNDVLTAAIIVATALRNDCIDSVDLRNVCKAAVAAAAAAKKQQ